MYLHKDRKGKIIYVGKAKNLRNRVRSYFIDNPQRDAKTATLVRQITDFDYIVTRGGPPKHCSAVLHYRNQLREVARDGEWGLWEVTAPLTPRTVKCWCEPF